ncbi:MAG: FAD-binding domain-containing protein [Alphaproteobacteria bacterium]
MVWFKRDLRVGDHAPLHGAAQAGPVLPLYIVEPELWCQPEHSGRQWAFITECLTELRRDLASLGQPLIIRVGQAVEILSDLADRGAASLWSHEETGQMWTFERDKAVAHWARARGLPWHEIPQHGIIRPLKTRNGWAGKWDRRMGKPVTPIPALKPVEGIEPGPIPSADDLGLAPDPCPERQSGGREAGLDSLYTFLHERGRDYRKAMSSPNTAFTACSRLSPHFAWGTVSIREAYQAARERQDSLRADASPDTLPWRQSIDSFIGRLHWHCHFMQKLEDETRIEFENLHRGYDGMREDGFDRSRFEAWCAGETGLPFLDACMRTLNRTGYLNFRMRAMVMSCSSYHLWLHWREPSLFLARQFTDFEPGIHYPQSQMQSGTTGINTVRIYNPVKQGKDHDPDGRFIRQAIPALESVPDKYIHEPWKMPAGVAKDCGVRMGSDYPDPIIDPVAAARAAKEKVYAARRGPAFRDEADAIQAKHGSRKSGMSQVSDRRGAARRKQADKDQMAMDLGDDGAVAEG